MTSFHRLVLVLTLFGAVSACTTGNKSASYEKLTGETMGTTYHITLLDTSERHLQPAIDSLLVVINRSMSTYEAGSIIWRINNVDSSVFYVDEHFFKVFTRAKEIYKLSEGAFNPAVMPLVNYWGFGPASGAKSGQTPERPPHTASILGEADAELDSLLALTNFAQFTLSKVVTPSDTLYRLHKVIPEAQLDFSAIAKGYGVDVVFEFLRAKGIEDCMVEIGGEVRARGMFENHFWRIGIETPENNEPGSSIQQVLELNDKSIATSGNYRNFIEQNGRQLGHTINPKSGQPEQNDLVSASVIANDCMTADALATACMVLGSAAALRLIETLEEVEALMILSDESVITTSGMNPQLADSD